MATRTPPKPPPITKPEKQAPEPEPDERDDEEETTPQEELAEALDAISRWVAVAESALDAIGGEEKDEGEGA